MREYLSDLLKKHKQTLTACGVALLFYLLLSIFIGCPIKYLTGISCAGCGMTRALICALRLDFAAAFCYHPLWIALPFVAFFLFFLKIKNNKKAFDILLYSSAFAMLAVYIYRLLRGGGDIVVFSPSSGAVYRLIQKVIEIFH